MSDITMSGARMRSTGLMSAINGYLFQHRLQVLIQ
jgi:hypothetical protein